jgi:hypothetical protein
MVFLHASRHLISIKNYCSHGQPRQLLQVLCSFLVKNPFFISIQNRFSAILVQPVLPLSNFTPTNMTYYASKRSSCKISALLKKENFR